MTISNTATIHESAYVDDNCVIGDNVRIWHFVHILSHTVVGDNSSLGQNVMAGPHVNIGSGCKIQNNVSLYEGVTLENNVFCGPSCVFTNVLTPRAHIERKSEFLKTRVGTGATIGANATILCGNNIGKYAMVAAGAVVTKDVIDHALVAGVPAIQIGWVSKAGARLDDTLICPYDGSVYHVVNNRLVESDASK